MERVDEGNRYDVMITYRASISPGLGLVGSAMHAAYFVCALVNPFCGILLGDATANLHAAFPGLERFLRGLLVAWAEHNDVCAR